MAVSEPLRFHSPFIKPDVRISRIRLSDQGDFMLSLTGSWVWLPLIRWIIPVIFFVLGCVPVYSVSVTEAFPPQHEAPHVEVD